MADKQTTIVKSPKEGLKIVAGAREHYLPGAEIVLNYGARSNRTLLSEYGFALEKDTLAYELVHVKVADVLKSSCNKAVWTFKVRKDVLCAPLLSAIRALLWNPALHPLDAAFDPGFTPLDHEVHRVCIALLQQHLSAFPTTIEDDEKLLLTWSDVKLYFAIHYRKQRKEAVLGQLSLLKRLLV